MRPRFLFTCSALLVALMGFGSSPASACGGYYGYGYGHGCCCSGHGYAVDVYYAPLRVYYAPRYHTRRWTHGPKARRVVWRRW
jgi:hypothetical protein